MSVIETILIFVAIPGAIYFAVGLFTLRSKLSAAPRYRPGQEWNHLPMWWTANPDGLTTRAAAEATAPAETMTLGGARGSW